MKHLCTLVVVEDDDDLPSVEPQEIEADSGAAAAETFIANACSGDPSLDDGGRVHVQFEDGSEAEYDVQLVFKATLVEPDERVGFDSDAMDGEDFEPDDEVE